MNNLKIFLLVLVCLALPSQVHSEDLLKHKMQATTPVAKAFIRQYLPTETATAFPPDVSKYRTQINTYHTTKSGGFLGISASVFKGIGYGLGLLGILIMSLDCWLHDRNDDSLLENIQSERDQKRSDILTLVALGTIVAALPFLFIGHVLKKLKREQTKKTPSTP